MVENDPSTMSRQELDALRRRQEAALRIKKDLINQGKSPDEAKDVVQKIKQS